MSACASWWRSARASPSAWARAASMQTGDILLTFRSEWGGAGAYPNVQMGISHTGVAYDQGWRAAQHRQSAEQEYLGPGNRGELNGEHYRTLQFIHVIRPRNLTDAERANIVAWATRLTTSASARLSEGDQLQPGLQRAQVQVGQAGRLRQAAGPDRARPGPARQRRHVLLGVRLVAAGAQGLRPGQVRRRVQEVRRALVRQADHGADEGDGRLHHAPRPLVLRRASPKARCWWSNSLEASRRRARQAAAHRVRREQGRPGQDVGRPPGGGGEDTRPTSRKLEKYYLGINGKWGPARSRRA